MGGINTYTLIKPEKNYRQFAGDTQVEKHKLFQCHVRRKRQSLVSTSLLAKCSSNSTQRHGRVTPALLGQCISLSYVDPTIVTASNSRRTESGFKNSGSAMMVTTEPASEPTLIQSSLRKGNT